jgi:hypothetical protein
VSKVEEGYGPAAPKKTPFRRLTRAEASGKEKVVQVKLDAPGAGPAHRYIRAELELRGIEHRGASFEIRVFLSNTKANRKTERRAENGYAGSTWVFGHGRCYGDKGHCEVPKRYRDEELRRPHPLTPVDRSIDVTAVLREVTKKSTKLSVTLVPVIQAANDANELVDVLQLDEVALTTYDLPA